MTTSAVSPAAPRTPRHAAVRRPLTQRVLNVVSIRIPTPVNALFDWVERHLQAAAGIGAILGSLVAAARVPSVFMYVVVSCVTAWVTSMFWLSKLKAMRADRDRLDQENGKLSEQVRKADRGDATALTQRMRSIGDHGEST